MTLEQGITNGRFFATEAETEKKRGGISYRKHTTLTAQFGCNYENLAAVKEMGERDSSRPSWFEHTEHDSIVRSKKDPSKLYLQIMNPRTSAPSISSRTERPSQKRSLSQWEL